MNGGSVANEDWAANLSDLNIAEDAVFTTVEENVFIDVVTGEGTLRTGFRGAGYEELTIGVMNGGANFDGLVEGQSVAADDLGALTKVGTGIQTFTGASTLHGDYTIQEGTLVYTSSSSIIFYPTLSDTTNQIVGGVAGSGTVDFDGATNIDFSGTDITFGNSWTLIDNSSLSAEVAPLAVTSTEGNFSEGASGVWTFTVFTGLLVFEEGSPPSGYSAFQVALFFPDEIEAGQADADFDFGGLNNGIEFVVGEILSTPQMMRNLLRHSLRLTEDCSSPSVARMIR